MIKKEKLEKNAKQTLIAATFIILNLASYQAMSCTASVSCGNNATLSCTGQQICIAHEDKDYVSFHGETFRCLAMPG